MRDVPKIFEYLKSTNVGESVDPNSPDVEAEKAAAAGDDVDQGFLAFGYHVYNGLQLQFDHPTDKSIARVVHRDVDLENHPSV
jgi:hypothetical protein